MNVFEFLGKSADYRASNKVVQLVKHYDEVNKNGKLHKKVSFPMFAQVKKDGVFAMLVMFNGQAQIFGRTGKKLSNVQHLEAQAMLRSIETGVYLAELCCDHCSLEELSGAVNPNRTKPLSNEGLEIAGNLYMAYHDRLSICEFVSGHSHRTYSHRHADLSKRMYGTDYITLPYIEVHSELELDLFADACIDRGEEGAVFKQDVEWLAGAKDWHAMKKVRKVEYDLQCINVEEGTGKYAGKVANLIFRWKGGKTIKAMLGKGWTHKDAEVMFNARFGVYNDDNPIGKIFRVKALQESSKGVLRLPKVGDYRHDKDTADF